MRRKSWRILLLSSFVTLLLIASAQIISTTLPLRSSSTILVAAAASLQQSLQEVTRLYLMAHPSQIVNYNFGASGALQQQIERGAPVDVYISAADKQMNDLEAKGLVVRQTRTDLLTNQLVLVVPKRSSVSVMNFRQLLQPEVQRIAIGEPRSVPAGQYATQVLKSLGIFDRVKSKFVLGNNVRSVLTAVETGDVDAGIVYITDAKISDRINIVASADSQLHSPIRYPIAVLNSSKSLPAARQYVEFLQTESAKAIFTKYGFGIAKPRS